MNGTIGYVNQTTNITAGYLCKYLIDFPTNYNYSKNSTIAVTLKKGDSFGNFIYLVAANFTNSGLI